MKLLTIAIPTYNRSKCLATCLEQLVKQVPGHEEDIDILVSDNCSTDDTAGVIARLAEQSKTIRTIRNSCNIGAENNFIQCLEQADSTFFMLLGDDDVLLDDGLGYLLEILKQEPCSSIFLRASVFFDDFRTEIARPDMSRTYTVYENPQEFIKRVNIDATFISSNIINKSRLPENTDIRRFNGTNLVQLGWILPSMIHADRCIYVDRAILAGKAFNSGGFRFFDTFAVNLNKIIEFFRHNGMQSATYDFFIQKLLTDFYPHRIFTIRAKKESYEDQGESIYRVFHDIYRNNPLFWVFMVPAIFMPVGMVKMVNKHQKSIYKRYLKLVNLFN